VELVCPRDHSALTREGEALACADGHRYPVVDDVPLLLSEDVEATHRSCWQTLEDPTLRDMDLFIKWAVASTCGNLYKHLIGNLPTYPIPQLPLAAGDGRTFLEVGCNWGRWCVSAARLGYEVSGVDSSLDGIRAARHVAADLGIDAQFVVGDARSLPFEDASFDVVFSYSVFQHFTRAATVEAFDEIGRVLKPGGTSLVQMANVWGARSLAHQARERRFREPRRMFDVRYWSTRELRSALERSVGPTKLSVDGFLTLNPQPGDIHLMPRRYRALVRASEAYRRASRVLPFLVHVADSVWAESRK
jgi:SAM-dependent methyltransferase